MKKFFVLIMILAFIFNFNVVEISAAYYDEGNDGTSWETAYIIDSVEDFKLMRDRVNNDSDDIGLYYKLNSDIDLSSEIEWEGINYFNGYFDGQYHTVYVNISQDILHTGLFEVISNSSTIIKRLKVSGSVKGLWAGGLVWGLGAGTIDDCTFNGTVESTHAWAGGFVDLMTGGTIKNSTFNGKVISATHSAGGFIAELISGSIENCKVTLGSEITGPSYAGGIIGLMHGGYAKDCTTEVILKDAPSKGGIVGGATTSVTSNLSGNTWPNVYTQVGLVSDILPDTPEEIEKEVIKSGDIQNKWNNHRYTVYNENLTWEQAKARCEALGGHLLTITSQAEQNFVQDFLIKSDTAYNVYWLGARANESGWWEWVTDEVFEKQYANFAEGQPDGSGIYLQIAVSSNQNDEFQSVQSAAVALGTWDDTNNLLGIEHGFICEWDEEQEEINSAPLASDFEEWQKNPEAWTAAEGDSATGSLPNPVDTEHLSENPPNIVTGTLPTSYDSRITHGLPSIRDQGNYQTCWAFAALGAMEADYKAQKMSSLGTSPDLSELHLAWFTYKNPQSEYENFINKNSNSILMEGGNTDMAVSFLSKVAAAPINESEMSYDIAGTDIKESNQKIQKFLGNKTLSDFNNVRVHLRHNNEFSSVNAKNTNLIKQAIMEHGAVYFSYHDITDDFNDDKTAFYSTKYDRSRSHAVLLVGWDDDYSVDNFKNKPNKKGAWLVRNSRGEDWGGDKGYFWMSYAQADDDNDAGMTDVRVFIISEDKAENDSLIVNEHDENGKTKDITSKWSTNIFQSKRHESLLKVAFYTTDNNAKYQIFVNNFGKNKPTDPGKAENPILSGDIAFAGYHTVELPTPVNLYSGDYYAVIVKMTLTSNYEYPTGVEASIDKYVNVVVTSGESFFASGNPVPSVWIDGADIENGPYNACIKVFTIARSINEIEPAIMTSAFPNAIVGEEYNFTLSSIGSESIEWRSGNIPKGLSLSRQGILTGQPEEAGNFDIKLTAFNNVGISEKTLTLTVEDASIQSSLKNNKNVFTSSNAGCNSGFNFLYGVFVFALFLGKRRK